MTFSLTVLTAKCHRFLPLELSASIMRFHWEVIYIKHLSRIDNRSSMPETEGEEQVPTVKEGQLDILGYENPWKICLLIHHKIISWLRVHSTWGWMFLHGSGIEHGGGMARCRPAVQTSTAEKLRVEVISAFCKGPVLLEPYCCCKAKWAGTRTLIKAFCISPAMSVIAVSSFFVLGFRQTPMWKHDN